VTFQEKFGTRYQKCRRLYDNLHTECFRYGVRGYDSVMRSFLESNNEAAGELLYTYNNCEQIRMLNELSKSLVVHCSNPISKRDWEQVAQSAKHGLMSSLVPYMRGITFRCVENARVDQKETSI
jgi:hypothetical protein